MSVDSPNSPASPVPGSDLNRLLTEFLVGLEGQKALYPYLHNDMSHFVPGQTPIFYSGPYWGREEVVAAMTALLEG